MAKKLELMEKPKGGNKNTSKFYLEIDPVNGVPYLCWEVFSINNKNHIFVMGFGFPLIPGGCYKPTVPSPASPRPSSAFSPLSHWKGKVTGNLCYQVASFVLFINFVCQVYVLASCF